MSTIWDKIGRNVNAEGTTTTYQLRGTQMIVQSRKRHIPRANRGGTWDHTSFFVLDNGVEVAEKWRLQDAKEYAERRAARNAAIDP